MAKKKAAKRVAGRQRKKVLLALEADTAAWLDERTAAAGATRTDAINLVLAMAEFLERKGHLRIGPGASVWFRPIPEPEVVLEQVQNGTWAKLVEVLGRDHWPIGMMLGRDNVPQPIGGTAALDETSK